MCSEKVRGRAALLTKFAPECSAVHGIARVHWTSTCLQIHGVAMRSAQAAVGFLKEAHLLSLCQPFCHSPRHYFNFVCSANVLRVGPYLFPYSKLFKEGNFLFG